MLLDLLKRTPKSRIINVSAKLHKKCGPLDLEKINDKNFFNSNFIVGNYALSKLANVLFTIEL